MQKTIYEDRKYCIQDVGNLYIGTGYTLGEIVESADISFKFQLIVERYILQNSDREDTLESILYYLKPDDFVVRILQQIKCKVKLNCIEKKEKKNGEEAGRYVTKQLPILELVSMPVEEKEKKGVVLQEIVVSKFALMTF